LRIRNFDFEIKVEIDLDPRTSKWELGAPWFKAEIHLGVESLVLLSDLIAHKILVLL
jgi:hypothetical protein